jgi:hypothetical protein
MKRKIPYASHGIKEQAAKVRKVWKANREFRISDASFEDFEKLHAGFDAQSKQVEEKRRELGELIMSRDKVAIKLNELVTRAYVGMRGYFGVQSPQYGQIKKIWPKKAARPTKPESTNPE